MKAFSKILLFLGSLALFGMIAGGLLVMGVISFYSKDLPDHTQLKEYKPPIVTRVHAGDGRLLAEFSREKRIFVPIEFIPDVVKNAFLSAEDKTFYSHPGLDFFGIVNAVIINVKNYDSGRRPVGASTITQQVAKNMVLMNTEQRYERKVREAILAMRIESAMTKDQILELYLNEIFLGSGAYGVAAAADEYFNKALPELEIHEAAYLAALPKAPSYYQMHKNHEDALNRRNWVIEQMLDNNKITEEEAEYAKSQPLERTEGESTQRVTASYFAEEVRRELVKNYGEDVIYYGGLHVKTTLDPKLQNIAERVLRDGLIRYERRHAYPGRVARFERDQMDTWQERLNNIARQAGMPLHWTYAVVQDMQGNLGLPDGSDAALDDRDWTWVQHMIPPRSVIMVEPVDETLADGTKRTEYQLRWVPEIQGGLVAIDPHTGRILAMQGGWSTEISSFNRVTQAQRQPGSAFKPFVYLTALEDDFTPATLILDAPIVIEQGPGQKKWKPTNYSNEFYGPTPLRIGVEKSRNLMTVRLADYVGMEKIAETARKFGIDDDMPPYLSFALGASETTLLKLTSAYAKLVNGGKDFTPTMIERIQDRYGETIYKLDQRVCDMCGDRIAWDPNLPVPEVPLETKQLTDPRHAYQIVSILEGVTKRGTATSVGRLGFPVAGKTGTTNDSRDAWFIGFTPDLVVGVFVGYDNPKPLGNRETGSSVAAPIFKAFMEEAMEGVSPAPFRMPKGIKLVKINAETGTRAVSGDERVIWEAFTAGTEPTSDVYILDGDGITLMPKAALRQDGSFESPGASTLMGTGGIY